MTDTPLQPLPRSLIAVAHAQLALGGLAVVDLLVGLGRGGIVVPLGILGIPIALGLRRRSAAWRTCCLAWTWVEAAAGVAALACIILAPAGGLRVEVLATSVERMPAAVPALVVVAFLALLAWQYRVLTRPDVRCSFVDEREYDIWNGGPRAAG